MQNYPVTILLKLRNKKQLKQKNEKKIAHPLQQNNKT